MNEELLREFLTEDADATVRQQLLEAIRAGRVAGKRILREFSFNRFGITLDFAADEVAIEDDLTTGPEGELRLGMAEFEKDLQELK